MPKPFKGVVNVDIRDSVPDWEPFLQPRAPEGAPNVLMIVRGIRLRVRGVFTTSGRLRARDGCLQPCRA